MKSRLILNPVAGTDSAPLFLMRMNEKLRDIFGDLDISLTTGAGDAREIAEKTARDENYSHIFIAGGDGTLNEVLNGVGRVENAFSRITFGLIPLGTGNDFADALGLPEDVEESLEIISRKRRVEIDVGQLNDKFFINVSAGGFIAEVSDAVNPELKTLTGKFAYLVGGAQVLFDYQPVKTKIKLASFASTFDAETAQSATVIEADFDIQMFAVCNSRLVGGGRMIAPFAAINDGFFDVCLVESMSTPEFLALLMQVPSGSHIEDARVEYFRTNEIEMTFEREIKVNADGEVFSTKYCKYKMLPRAAKFYVGDAPFLRKD